MNLTLTPLPGLICPIPSCLTQAMGSFIRNGVCTLPSALEGSIMRCVVTVQKGKGGGQRAKGVPLYPCPPPRGQLCAQAPPLTDPMVSSRPQQHLPGLCPFCLQPLWVYRREKRESQRRAHVRLSRAVTLNLQVHQSPLEGWETQDGWPHPGAFFSFYWRILDLQWCVQLPVYSKVNQLNINIIHTFSDSSPIQSIE